MTEVSPVASLPMYDWPEVRWATDALWDVIAGHIRRQGLDAPAGLDRERSSDEIWADPKLLLSQTCGYPFTTRLRGTVRLVGTPVYAVDGCEGASYSSVIVARRGGGTSLPHFAGRRFALNGRESLSGGVALLTAMRESGIDAGAVTWIETGSHRASVRAVAAGEADVAAVDAVCWDLAGRFEPDAVSALAVIDRTPLRPGLPLVTAGARGQEEIALLREALSDTLADPAAEAARDALRMVGFAALEERDYLPIFSLPGFPEKGLFSRPT